MNKNMIITGQNGIGKTNHLGSLRIEMDKDSTYTDTIVSDVHLCEYLIDMGPETKTGFQELFVDDKNKTFGWYVFEPLAFRPELQRNGGRKGNQLHDKVNSHYLGAIARYKTLDHLAKIKPEVIDYDMKVIGPNENLSEQVKKHYDAMGINVYKSIPYTQLKEKVANFLVEKGILTPEEQ